MRRASFSERGITTILLIAIATPVMYVTRDVHTAGILAVATVLTVNVAYWKWRRYRGDVLVEEYGTPYAAESWEGDSSDQ